MPDGLCDVDMLPGVLAGRRSARTLTRSYARR